MSSIILPITYFPNLIWYSTFLRNENVELEINENFIKQSYRNRTEIYGPNGILNLIIPINHSKEEKISIKNVEINYDSPWQKVHWSSIEAAYRRSSYFEYYESYLRIIFEERVEKLVDINIKILKIVNRLMKIDKPLKFTEEFLPLEKDLDYRLCIHPKKRMEGKCPEYYQLFSNKHGFIGNLSILDLLFTKGPDSLEVLKSVRIKL